MEKSSEEKPAQGRRVITVLFVGIFRGPLFRGPLVVSLHVFI